MNRQTVLSYTSLGELISVVYAAFLARYGDEELASVATAAVVNEALAKQRGATKPVVGYLN